MMVVSLVVAGSVSKMSQSWVGMVCIHTLLDTNRRLELNFFPNILSAEKYQNTSHFWCIQWKPLGVVL